MKIELTLSIQEEGQIPFTGKSEYEIKEVNIKIKRNKFFIERLINEITTNLNNYM